MLNILLEKEAGLVWGKHESDKKFERKSSVIPKQKAVLDSFIQTF